MSRLVKTLKYAFKKMEARKWDTVYIFVDMHETAVTPTWTTDTSTELYPKCLETLQLMSENKNIKLILWSSSLPHVNLEYQKMFRELGVNFDAINGNPFEAATTYADFESKPYMSLILDDKAGFLPGDWEDLYDYLLLLKTLKLLREFNKDGKIVSFLEDLKINLDYAY